jgi:hypothetical protein
MSSKVDGLRDCRISGVIGQLEEETRSYKYESLPRILIANRLHLVTVNNAQLS